MERFTEADYDFSDIKSREELQACNWYEYARESLAMRNVIATEREERIKSGGKTREVKFDSRVRNSIQSHHLMMLACVSGFPDIPWKGLLEAEKLIQYKMWAVVPRLLRYALTWFNPPLSFVTNEPGATTLDMWKQKYQERNPLVMATEPIKFGFFAVNMKYGHPVLIEEFAGCLRTFEGKPVLDYPPAKKKSVEAKPPGRKSIHDTLNALGIMRLRYQCDTFSEAKEKMQALKAKRCGMFYARRDAANRACNLALRHFQQFFGWIDSAKPIHFTDGWRGTQKCKTLSESASIINKRF